MPTPVSTARQCLTQEAAQALTEAVAVARRRSHGQTTSLHAVSALLSLPSSPLREACGRARSGPYTARVQFKALELCLGVSLDRLPSTPQRSEEPPVSNSLMAAIKRSQANQRRQPECFHLYQNQQQSSSVSAIKVELQSLVLAILDDPVVSRVLGEAGFRSYDVKLAILRPVHQLVRYSRYRGPQPPMFLCNFTDPDVGNRKNFKGFSFPFEFPNDGDENCRRIGEVLVRNKGRNPLLIGVSAHASLRNFCETVDSRKGGYVLPVEIYGLEMIRMDSDVSMFMSENCDEEMIRLRFGQVSQRVEQCSGPGVLVSYGDLKVLLHDDSGGVADGVVAELTRLLDVHGGKVWLAGAADTYETYLQFLNRFPSIEKDLDVHILPITSLSPPRGESYPRSSLMESFVPFGGLFSTSSDLKSLSCGPFQCQTLCQLCNEKCMEEISSAANGGLAASVVGENQSSSPSWFQTNEVGTNIEWDAMKARNDGLALSAKVKEVQRKWDNICRRLHHAEPVMKGTIYEVGSEIPALLGFQVGQDMKENAKDQSSYETTASSIGSGCGKVTSCISIDAEKASGPKQSSSLPGSSKFMVPKFVENLGEKTSESEDVEVGGFRLPPLRSSNSCVGDDHKSPPSASSVTTDLGLAVYSAPTIRELAVLKYPASKGSSSTLAHSSHASSCSSLVFGGQCDQRDFKFLYRALSEKLGCQDEAIASVTQAISNYRTRNQKRFGANMRGDMWLTFLGPDCFSKKRIAMALSEILYGSGGNFICVDLCSEKEMTSRNIAVSELHDLDDYGVMFRGKTTIDYVVEELRKKPFSVVFLGNVDKADVLTHNSLSQALRTGRFMDSHGREVGTGNAIFVATSTITKDGQTLSTGNETSIYSEESIRRAKASQMQLIIRNDSSLLNTCTREGVSNSFSMNKRKLIGAAGISEKPETTEMAKRSHKAPNINLDLNLPAEDIDVERTDSGNSGMDLNSKDSLVWFDDFVQLVDEVVVFKPFDFDNLAQKISKQITNCLHNSVGSEVSLEIDSNVMEQILAAACLSEDNKVDEWIKQVLSKGFVEAQKRYKLSASCVVKMISCHGLSIEDHASGIRLPSRIFVN